jgi:metallo-beta-lactamase family protein
MPDSLRVFPLGAAGTVTGSRFLVQGGRSYVLVDCGLFQGLKHLRLRNWQPFPFPPDRLRAVVLTHAHLDHSGWLPILVREGYRGPIFATPATMDLLPILLSDAGRLQEEDARYAARKGFSRHADPRPLFTERDAEAVIPLLEPLPFGGSASAGSLTFTPHRAGHILGAASIHMAHRGGASVLFSGDLGRSEDPLLPPPAPRVTADRVVMECTYGDRDHAALDGAKVLADAVRRTAARGGVLMVPTFALGRAQTLALLLYRLVKAGEIPSLPMYLDSPMAIRVSGVHQAHTGELLASSSEMDRALARVEPISSVEESRALYQRHGPMVVLAGAGMLTGGRILHHLKVWGGDPKSTLFLAGFQAEGTRGRDLVRGERSLRIHGETVPIRCELVRVDAFSGHADRTELMNWLTSGPPAAVSLVHGEPGAAEAFRRQIAVQLGWDVEVAEERRPLGEPFPKGWP